ncbi:thioredoxin family protein [Bacillus sp. B15-48]|uniref:thioredoxin family protein n=1 Tax=Bacillus sp. B15-48 TaxID=1548601 RepID=UPI0019401416|nr:thioredoxin family protein [Bacillus sp. B15-48]MBM4760760.1 thioredoxin [Bacillus sp. B15-48]
MENWSADQIEQFMNEGKTGVLYFFTPLCGTCQMAAKMVEIVTQLYPELEFGKADLNYMPEIAKHFAVKSVPGLFLFHNGIVEEKIFAFHSVPYLSEKIKQILL